MANTDDEQAPKSLNGETGDYDWGWPSDPDKWARAVNDAISDKKLIWKRDLKEQYILSGSCPHCQHKTAQIIPLEVISAETVTASHFGGANTELTIPGKVGSQGITADELTAHMRITNTDATQLLAKKARLVTMNFTCLCEEKTPHRKDTKGCGAGAGMEMDIRIMDPRPTPSSPLRVLASQAAKAIHGNKS